MCIFHIINSTKTGLWTKDKIPRLMLESDVSNLLNTRRAFVGVDKAAVVLGDTCNILTPFWV